MPDQIPATLRRTLLAPLDPRGRVEEVEQRLGEAIELGAFADGEQLPNETALAAQLGVATVTLRDALAGLRRSGLLDTRRGRGGGSFVRQPEAARRERLTARLSAYGADELRDAGDLHAAISSAAARLAAERATPADHRRLLLRVQALATAATQAERRLADRRFHIELATASGSLQLTRSEAQLQADARALLWMLLAPADVFAAVDEHRAILDAVVHGDADAASRLMREHLARETEALVARRLALDVAAGSATDSANAHATARRGRAAVTTALARVLDAAERAADEVFDVLALARDAVLLARDAARDIGRPLASGDLAGLEACVSDALAGHPTLLGMGMALAPAAAPDVSWAWWQTSDGAPRPLVVNLDPAHPELYDYETAEWFAAPRAAGAPWIAGPFVDFGAADEHIFTFTLPIPDGGAGQPPIGVVGADVPVRRIEQLVGPALAALRAGTDAALVNRHGVVIASSTARRLPGTTWAPPRAGTLRRTSQRLGWSVVARTR